MRVDSRRRVIEVDAKFGHSSLLLAYPSSPPPEETSLSLAYKFFGSHGHLSHPSHELASYYKTCILKKKRVSTMASKGLIVFALLLAAAFLVTAAEQTRELAHRFSTDLLYLQAKETGYSF
jgi:hypothetical protein